MYSLNKVRQGHDRSDAFMPIILQAASMLTACKGSSSGHSRVPCVALRPALHLRSWQVLHYCLHMPSRCEQALQTPGNEASISQHLLTTCVTKACQAILHQSCTRIKTYRRSLSFSAHGPCLAVQSSAPCHFAMSRSWCIATVTAIHIDSLPLEQSTRMCRREARSIVRKTRPLLGGCA